VISYQDLEQHVCALAEVLENSGVRSQDKVLIRMAKSPHQIAAVLAILRVGATFVPIDMEWPCGRIQRIAEDTAAAFAVVDIDEPLFEPPSSVLEINVHALSKETSVPARFNERAQNVEPEHLAYIVYTSGSRRLWPTSFICI